MLFGKKKYQLSCGRLVSPIPQLGDAEFTVSCFVHLEGEKAGSPKWGDVVDRPKFRLELQLHELDDGPENKATTVDGLGGLTSVSVLSSEIMEDGGLRFDLKGLHIVPKIDKGTFRLHVELSLPCSNPLRGSKYELVAEADSEPFTRGDMTKHRLPDGWEWSENCGGFR